MGLPASHARQCGTFRAWRQCAFVLESLKAAVSGSFFGYRTRVHSSTGAIAVTALEAVNKFTRVAKGTRLLPVHVLIPTVDRCPRPSTGMPRPRRPSTCIANGLQYTHVYVHVYSHRYHARTNIDYILKYEYRYECTCTRVLVFERAALLEYTWTYTFT